MTAFEDTTEYATVGDPSSLFTPRATYDGREVRRRLERWSESLLRTRLDPPAYRRDPSLTWWERAGEWFYDRIMPTLAGIGIWIITPSVTIYFIVLCARALFTHFFRG